MMYIDIDFHHLLLQPCVRSHSVRQFETTSFLDVCLTTNLNYDEAWAWAAWLDSEVNEILNFSDYTQGLKL